MKIFEPLTGRIEIPAANLGFSIMKIVFPSDCDNNREIKMETRHQKQVYCHFQSMAITAITWAYILLQACRVIRNQLFSI